MAEIMKREPKGYGTQAKMSGDAGAKDKTSRHNVFKGMVPSGESEMGSEKKFDGGRQGGVCYTHDRSHYKG